MHLNYSIARNLIGLMLLFTPYAFTLAQPSAVMTDPQQITSQRQDDLAEFTVEKLFRTRTTGDTAWSPDGKQVAFVSNISGRMNLWLISAEGGWPSQLTVSDQRQTSPAWSPNGKWIAYTSDRDGDEQWDVFVVSPANGDVLSLSNTPEISEENPAWSPDSRYLAWQAKPHAGANYEIETFDLLLRRRRALTANTPKRLSNFHPLWSPDGKWIAYTQMRAGEKDGNVLVIEVATGKSVNLTSHEGEQVYSASAWSPDGKKLLITSNALNGFENVGLLDTSTKAIDWLTQAKWDSEAGGFSPDGKYATWTTNTDGNEDLDLYDLAAKRVETLPVAKGVNSLGGAESAFSRDGSRLLYYHEGPEAPKDVWVYALAGRRSHPNTPKPDVLGTPVSHPNAPKPGVLGTPVFHQLTQSLVAGVRSQDLVEPNLVHYPSADGKFTISAWVYAPYNQIKNGQVPAIVWVHGGPTSQSMNSFNRGIQFLVNLGYFVITPNYRGSTGYGKEFLDANRLDMGGGDLQDVLAAARWISKTGYVDPKKLVVLGGSYGGYLSMMAVTQAPETWAAGIALMPFVNWFTEVQNEDPRLQQYDLATMGDGIKNKALWEERSPINFVDRIKAPLLLLAGDNDPRCPQEEAQQVADAVHKKGGKAELKVYAGEGHGFARIENQLDAWKRIASFLKFYVPAPGCGVSACEVQ